MTEKKRKNFNKKKELIEKKSKNNLYLMVFCFIAAALAIGYAVYPKTQGTSGSSGSSSGRANVGAITYSSNTEMTDIKSTVENGKIVFSLDDVKKYKFVGLTYPKNQVDIGTGKKPLPILAYISPSGDVVTAVSMCEPCKGLKFHYETDNTITCNVCGTKWSIETLKGISGGCMTYPPDEIKNQVKNGKIYIDESEVSSWKPRV